MHEPCLHSGAQHRPCAAPGPCSAAPSPPCRGHGPSHGYWAGTGLLLAQEGMLLIPEHPAHVATHKDIPYTLCATFKHLHLHPT